MTVTSKTLIFMIINSVKNTYCWYIRKIVFNLLVPFLNHRAPVYHIISPHKKQKKNLLQLAYHASALFNLHHQSSSIFKIKI